MVRGEFSGDRFLVGGVGRWARVEREKPVVLSESLEESADCPANEVARLGGDRFVENGLEVSNQKPVEDLQGFLLFCQRDSSEHWKFQVDEFLDGFAGL